MTGWRRRRHDIRRGDTASATTEDAPAGQIAGRVAIYVLLSIGAVGAAFPFFWMLTTSLKTRNEATATRPSVFPAGARSGSNYVEAWNTAPFGRYFFNTTFIAIMVVLGMSVHDGAGGICVRAARIFRQECRSSRSSWRR